MKPPWIPQDDLLLKNAVEAGASLESLAKGAVQFSRKYTVTELRDRWLSLLYDPDISASASASMVSLELPGPGALSKSSGNGIKEGMAEGAAAKRKVKSIRRQYYAMRKRICRQIFGSFDMAVHDEMTIVDGSACENNAVQYDECHAQNCIEGGKLGRNFGLRDIRLGKIGDGVSLVRDHLSKDRNNLLLHNLVGYGNYSGLEEVGPSPSMLEVPLWKSIEDVPVPAMPVQVSLENKNHDATEARVMLPHGLKSKCATDVLNASIPISGEDAANLSDSLLNLTPEDEPLLMEIDGKDATDKPCYDSLDSLLLNSPGEIQENDAPDLPKSQKSHTENTLAIPGSESAAGLEAVANPLDSSCGELHSVSDPGNDVQSFVGAQSPSLKLSDEFMYCTLNTEDPDIPCNDNIDPSVVIPYSVTLKSQPVNKEVGQSDCSINNNQRKKEPEGSLKKEDIPSHSFAASQTVRPVLVANINSSHPPVSVPVKIETAGRNPISAVPRQSNNVNINPIYSRLLHATMMPTSDEHLKQQETNTPFSAKVNKHSKAEELEGLTKSEANSLSLNQEGDDDDSDDDGDGDRSIPYFSDAETMILEMDLDPTDQDFNATREVSRYQDAETKKTIMRLEQCAQSFLNRAIASQGAFALLYGRKLKQYIKKSEVILGRATDDVQVDIDLGREGRANKISRRQALIRMEANGSFVIKNLGKSSIFLNGKEVAKGQLRRLGASSLIEIRGLSFIFEINEKSVERFLENLDRTGGTLRRQW